MKKDKKIYLNKLVNIHKLIFTLTLVIVFTYGFVLIVALKAVMENATSAVCPDGLVT